MKLVLGPHLRSGDRAADQAAGGSHRRRRNRFDRLSATIRRHRPGETVDVSVLAGRQVEHLMGIFQMPGIGDWWLFFDTDLLGHYPRDMFTMLHAGACGSAYYGEAARREPNPPPPPGIPWAKTEVGSGQTGKAAQPLLTAYVRKPQYIGTFWALAL